MQAVAAGLYTLHSQSIAHMDLKSLNILLDDSHRAKIADLGLGKLMMKNETVATQFGEHISLQSRTTHWQVCPMISQFGSS